jgi:site-specific recombinase XerD
MPLAPRTLAEYRAALRRLGTPVESLNFGSFNPEMLPQQVSPASWEHLGNSARLMFRAAIRWAWTEAGSPETGEAVAATIPLKHEVKRIKKYPTREEVQRFLDVARGLPSPERDLLLFDVALGLRREELLTLSREAIEAALTGDKVLRFVRKGQIEAELPAEHVAKQLRSLLRQPMMLGRDASLDRTVGEWTVLWQVLGTSFRGAYDKLCRVVASTAKKAECSTHWTPHVMRHAFATELIRDGADLTVVQRAMNHSSYTTTLRYVHIQTADLKPWMKQRGD